MVRSQKWLVEYLEILWSLVECSYMKVLCTFKWYHFANYIAIECNEAKVYSYWTKKWRIFFGGFLTQRFCYTHKFIINWIFCCTLKKFLDFLNRVLIDILGAYPVVARHWDASTSHWRAPQESGLLWQYLVRLSPHRHTPWMSALLLSEKLRAMWH